MSKEFEIKTRVEDLKEVKKKLKLYKFKFEKKVKLTDFILSHNSLNESLWARLRLINNNKKPFVAIKSPKKGSNKNESNEIEFKSWSNIDSTLRVAEALGFTTLLSYSKTREVFVKNNIEIVLDKVPGLGNFMEIEVQEKTRKQATKILSDYKKKFGIKKVIKKGYYGLFQEKEKSKLFG
ncbi:MAG: class IV adenylate cyclase [archaeon]